jgi:dTDP-4-amino-4,6-dideoxygalactose transaminase
MTPLRTLPFNTLAPLHARLKDEIDAAIAAVLDRAYYLLGPECAAFEQAFAAWHDTAEPGHAVGVANGTDAIELVLRALGIGPGSDVITVAHTAVPTVCAVERAGARPVLVDIDPATYTISPAALAAAVTPKTRAIVPVHLYGHPADMTAIMAIADAHGLPVIEDCAQAHGARWNGRRVGTFGRAAAYSFYPTKNLGAYGDGGGIFTRDAALAERLRGLRNYGQTTRYIHAERGINSRLDEVQAAILRVKLAHLDACNAERRALAAVYTRALADVPGLVVPGVRPEAEHVFHLYVVRLAGPLQGARTAFMERLNARGIGTLIHYPVPIHRQAAYADLGYPEGALPHTEMAAANIVSLPLFIGMTADDAAYAAHCVAETAAELAGQGLFSQERGV